MSQQLGQELNPHHSHGLGLDAVKASPVDILLKAGLEVEQGDNSQDLSSYSAQCKQEQCSQNTKMCLWGGRTSQ